jgi:TetR/AcrR family transcriptional regulator, mexJK operon transcriptional repressor
MVPARLTPRMAAKRDHILQTATHLFMQRGFTGTSMDLMAAEAKVSKQTLYRYYSNKEDLLYDVLTSTLEQLNEEKIALTLGNPLPRNQDELQCALLELAETVTGNLMSPKYLALARIVISEITRSAELGNIFREAVQKRVLHSIVIALQQSRHCAMVKIRDDELEMAARMFVGPLLTFILHDGLMLADEPLQPDRNTLGTFAHMFVRLIT